ncbi:MULTISPECIES: Coenzyme F420 hydrogenase/dehydrogenase, beta subunit C-terminal domain [Blautia]|uniref:Coenzyme F420 hydrogenase/dehydrogenase, beta subunit C-terminal domain n=1 Tax=Blautia TaxID=572511 RepID=UPI001D05FD98|nr:Coenzyme F420 hydrogenase/dehydrogenase, beta subunit C-terminal domain [Blautia marasmi]MCB6194753.1 Coenzyme F420 hydrogenase/dehydrogenase, beta subunit C-terminal domain [Blautia marasmi]
MSESGGYTGAVKPLFWKTDYPELWYPSKRICGTALPEQQFRITRNTHGSKKCYKKDVRCKEIGTAFREMKGFLKAKRLVLFVGTPCQVSRLLSLVGNNRKTLITVDMVCHGVASLFVWKEYLKERCVEDARYSRIVGVNLRDKSTGWSRYSYSVSIKYANGKEYKRSQCDDAFLNGFVNNLYLRPSCESCAFKGIDRESEITLGDCW